jgi:transcriptional regulator with XRE-family HTH domain
MAVLFSFGAWLKQRPSALLLSRDELARQVECAEVTLRKIEADERRPSLAVAERLADRLELAGDERTLFTQVARGLGGIDRLPSPVPRGGAAPGPSVAPTPAPLLPSGTVAFLFTDIEGSTTLEAVEVICKADRHLVLDTLDGLALLVDNSLLQRADSATSNGYREPRFVMLETIREYALERLNESGEAELVRQGHADYFLTPAETTVAHVL